MPIALFHEIRRNHRQGSPSGFSESSVLPWLDLPCNEDEASPSFRQSKEVFSKESPWCSADVRRDMLISLISQSTASDHLLLNTTSLFIEPISSESPLFSLVYQSSFATHFLSPEIDPPALLTQLGDELPASDKYISHLERVLIPKG